VAANGGRAVYVRLNPDDPEPLSQNPAGDGVAFHRWQAGWEVLEPFVAATVEGRDAAVAVGSAAPLTAARNRTQPHARAARNKSDARSMQQYYTNLLHSLRTPRHTAP
jgi:hypothetical protein